MDADTVAAIVLAVLAVVMLVVGCAIHLGAQSDRRRPTPPPADQIQAPDFDSERARKFHGSDQWGR